ncbi:hypothetical protein UFOVP75_166 [uncultured Caudovirales phage]|uniref:Uncharacterized protein n=1 Tax=uncultured Caudovirales phage TaxID=2100421 RepID=A0A6J5L2D2_9CAUD|nr:hypothetical protein UFOVP75_166 [uncultured Caudovirales phage]
MRSLFEMAFGPSLSALEIQLEKDRQKAMARLKETLDDKNKIIQNLLHTLENVTKRVKDLEANSVSKAKYDALNQTLLEVLKENERLVVETKECAAQFKQCWAALDQDPRRYSLATEIESQQAYLNDVAKAVSSIVSDKRFVPKWIADTLNRVIG